MNDEPRRLLLDENTFRLDEIERELKRLREVEHQRRINAGAQLALDHDRSARWQPKQLPTYNP